MIDFDSLWEELYLNITLEECDEIIKQVQQVRETSIKMLEHLVELRHGLREVKKSHVNGEMGGAGTTDAEIQ